MPHPLSLFKYCPRCGCAGFADNDAYSRRCPHCGFVYYHNASAATVAVVVNARGELLCVRRGREPARGTLDLPGGFVDPGESVTDGLLREVREELGAEVASWCFLFSLPDSYPYSGFTVHTADSFFLCRLRDVGCVAAHDDATEVVWIAADKLRPSDFGLPSIREGVKLLLEKKEEYLLP